jgi:hypothetical protein
MCFVLCLKCSLCSLAIMKKVCIILVGGFMKIERSKQNVLDVWAEMSPVTQLQLTKQELEILEKAKNICSRADDLIKTNVDDTTDFGLAEMYLSEILEEVETKRGYYL